MTQPTLNQQQLVVSRDDFLRILNTGMEVAVYRYVRQTAFSWLSQYPGDLDVALILARALMGEGKYTQAVTILEHIARMDPEFAEAYELLVVALEEDNDERFRLYVNCAFATGKHIRAGIQVDPWAGDLRDAINYIKQNNVARAKIFITKVLARDLAIPLPSVLHTRVMEVSDDPVGLMTLCQIYHERWPDCLQFKLNLASSKIELGDETYGLELMHQCVTGDAIGKVAKRMWKKDHPFIDLWPDNIQAQLNLSIPSEIAGRLGWNILPANEELTAANNIPVPADPVKPEIAAELSALQPIELDDIVEDKIEKQAASPEDIEKTKQSAELAISILDKLRAEAVRVEFPDLESPVYKKDGAGAELAEPPLEVDNFDGEVQSQSPIEEERTVDQIPYEELIFELQKAAEVPEKILTDPLLIESAEFSHPANDTPIGEVVSSFKALAKKLNYPGIMNLDSRFPVYVVFSSYKGLIAQYGDQTAAIIRTELIRLVEVIRQRPGWSATWLFPDDPKSAAEHGIKPVDKPDPWALKLALTDLDKQLQKRGERVGAVLIVGGNEVVPFHKLPNPTDDSDTEIYSDNPYSTSDKNYFIPEWPTGRLPGEAGADVGLLLEQIRTLVRYHLKYRRVEQWRKPALSFSWLFDLFKRLGLTPKSVAEVNLGYTAAVWKRSSLAVFKPMGDSKNILVSPPAFSGGFQSRKVNSGLIGYYNLHGLVDSADWYGQRDLSLDTVGPDYPTALSPKDLVKNGKAPRVIFSEACYAGHILNKNERESIALKFLSIGSLVVVGSTAVSYGSVDMPLIGADMLANSFWRYLKDGFSSGEALMQAKIDLAREMNRRQSYLDGEDQKTLISFVLYGDPLVALNDRSKTGKGLVRLSKNTSIRYISEQKKLVPDDSISEDVIEQVKTIVAKYLPGLGAQEVSISRPQISDKDVDPTVPYAQSKNKSENIPDSKHLVVTVSKQVKITTGTHRQYAKMTMDVTGKMVKLAISK
jgi:tetratricopeptide (TPR) repeat protein